MTNVLITSVSRKVWLVRAFRAALAAHGGGKVMGADASPLSPGLYLADEHRVIARSDTPGFARALATLCQELDVRLLIPTRDEELPLLAAERSLFDAVGTVVMVSSPAAIDTCQDKVAFMRFCREHGFGLPAAVEPLSSSRFPVFVKPRRGKSGHGARPVDGPEELRAALAADGELIVQEQVEAPEYTVDVFADFDGRVLSAVPRERIRVFGGESFVGRTVELPRLMDEAVRLVEALGLVGHVTVQAFVRGDEVLFIEVNPRFGGGAALGFAAGAPTPEWLLALVHGERVEPRLGAFRGGLFMLRYTDDLFIAAGDLR